MRNHRVDTDIHDQLDVVIVGPRAESRKSANQARHQRFRGTVDGQRTEPRRCAYCRVQCLRHAVAGCVHTNAAAEKDAHRGRTVLVDGFAQPGTDVIQTALPRNRLKSSIGPQQRSFQPPRMVVHFRERRPLRAHIAVRHRMIAITPHAHDPLTLQLHDNAAHRRADTAIAALGSGFTFVHTRPNETYQVSLL